MTGMQAAWWNTGLAGLLPALTGGPLTPLYAVMLGLIAAYWWGRVWREARLGYAPRVAWWAVPGLGALLLAQLLDVPALFGVGAGLLLLAEFWPAAFVPAPGRSPQWERVGWALVGVVLAGTLILSPGPLGPRDPWTGVTGLLALVACVAVLLSVLGRPRGARRPGGRALVPPLKTVGFTTRWAEAVSPAWPELSVTLTGNGAQLRNVSPRPLLLAGWSPAGVNAWMRPRRPDGTPLEVLGVGEEVFVPLGPGDGGVRVWYRPERPDAPPHLFRADWVPARPAGAERVLN